MAEAGLNLQAVFPCATLPEAVLRPWRENGIPLEHYTHLILLGHGGRRLWDKLQTFGMKTADPVDHYSLTITRQYIERYLDNAPHLILYPLANYPVPLTRLGELAGWSYPSPVGLGINPIYGLWFAYRVAFLVNSGRQLAASSQPQPAAHPCAACAGRPCIAACPASAVQPDPRQFDISSCARYRLQSQSACADRCLARLACPAAPEHRYSLAQIRYHYRQSLITIREWQNTRATPLSSEAGCASTTG